MTLASQYKDRSADLLTFLLLVSIIGYPLLGSLVALTSLSSLVASVPVRALIVILSLALLTRIPSALLLKPQIIALLTFWFVYLFRIIWDLYVNEVAVAEEFLFTFLFFCLPPAFAVLGGKPIDEGRLARYLLICGSATCAVALLIGYGSVVSARVTGEVLSGRFALETVNPITFGHAGVTTVIAAVWMLTRTRLILERIACVAAIVAGGAVMQIAASRGPLIALVGCALFLVLVDRRFAWLTVPLLAMIAGTTVVATGEIDNIFASRLAASVDQADSPELRVLMMAGASQQFLDNPLLGSSIVEFGSQDYPHNFLLEAAMATGILGLLLMLLISGNALWNAVQSVRRREVLVSMLLVQAVVAALFSGTISASNTLWTLLAYFAVRSTAAGWATSSLRGVDTVYRAYVKSSRS